MAKVLRESLAPDILELVSSSVQCEEPNCLQVVQTQDAAPRQPQNLVSPSNSLVAAVVDRTANLEEAARALTTARMSFGGKSPYAPDVILVNEFVKRDFLQAVIRHSIQYMAAENGGASAQKRAPGAGRAELKGVRVITSGSNGSILDVEDRYVSHYGKAATSFSLTDCLGLRWNLWPKSATGQSRSTRSAAWTMPSKPPTTLVTGKPLPHTRLGTPKRASIYFSLSTPMPGLRT